MAKKENWTKIIVFGASITYGAWDKEGGWADRLKRYFHKLTLSESGNYYVLYNVGVSGNRTGDLLDRFESDTKIRIHEDNEVLLVFSVGTNDSAFVHRRNNTWTSPEEYGENLNKLFEAAKGFSQKMIFVGLLPVDESKVDPVPWDPDISYRNAYTKKFNGIAKHVCKKNGVYFIDFFDEWINSDYKELLEDGVHPNTKGHEEIFEKVKDVLEKMI